MVEILSKKYLEAHVYKNYKVNALGKKLTIDLILLDFFEFDIILAGDCLENYWTIIDCDNKIVTACLKESNLKTKMVFCFVNECFERIYKISYK